MDFSVLPSRITVVLKGESPKYYNSVIIYTPSVHFKHVAVWSRNGDILQNVNSALFHAMKVNDHQLPKKKHHSVQVYFENEVHLTALVCQDIYC